MSAFSAPACRALDLLGIGLVGDPDDLVVQLRSMIMRATPSPVRSLSAKMPTNLSPGEVTRSSAVAQCFMMLLSV